MMKQEVNGWHLPGRDSYFSRFVQGGPAKRNGFNREHLELALTHVKAWDVAVDVGAHVGFWTVDMAARFEHVLAFEPSLDTYECLVKNTQEFNNVTCCNAAVGPASGKCQMVDDRDRPGNTGARYAIAGGQTEMIALDELLLCGCDFLKIDVEGYEAEVLCGAKALINVYKPVIIMETDKRFGGRYGIRRGQARVDILEMGYREVEYVERHKRDPRRMVNAIRPDRIFVHDS